MEVLNQDLTFTGTVLKKEKSNKRAAWKIIKLQQAYKTYSSLQSSRTYPNRHEKRARKIYQ